MAAIPILTDDDVDSLISMREAVAAVEGALARKATGGFLTPPRHYFTNAHGKLAFTIGGDNDAGVAGFRVYGTFAGSGAEGQLVVVYDAESGELLGIVQGERIGAMRTGALGGVAVKYASREDSRVIAVIGSGTQARTQLEAVATVRDLTEARVFSRSAANREAFAAEMSARLAFAVRPVDTVEDALAGADIVIVATNSRTPAFDGSLIRPGQHVTTVRLGRGQHELDASVADRASTLFTDSPEQVRDYPGGFFLEERIDEVGDLSEYVGRGEPVRKDPDEITLYLSAGLSGTEVVVAAEALRKARGQ
jgi:ornithine cyclodeaminase